MKKQNDPSFKVPIVKIVYDNGIMRIIRKDKGIRLEITGSLATNIIPAYETVK